jgi:hypothetical protein
MGGWEVAVLKGDGGTRQAAIMVRLVKRKQWRQEARRLPMWPTPVALPADLNDKLLDALRSVAGMLNPRASEHG